MLNNLLRTKSPVAIFMVIYDRQSFYGFSFLHIVLNVICFPIILLSLAEKNKNDKTMKKSEGEKQRRCLLFLMSHFGPSVRFTFCRSVCVGRSTLLEKCTKLHSSQQMWMCVCVFFYLRCSPSQSQLHFQCKMLAIKYTKLNEPGERRRRPTTDESDNRDDMQQQSTPIQTFHTYAHTWCAANESRCRSSSSSSNSINFLPLFLSIFSIGLFSFAPDYQLCAVLFCFRCLCFASFYHCFCICIRLFGDAFHFGWRQLSLFYADHFLYSCFVISAVVVVVVVSFEPCFSLARPVCHFRMRIHFD